MTADLSRARRTPFAHQVVGVERMLPLVEPERGRVYPGCFGLFDEMRMGKTAQIINLAQILFTRGELKTVIVAAPAPVRDVWFDPELGEIAKHRWLGLPIHVREYHTRKREWTADYEEGKPFLRWVCANYEYVRSRVKYVKNRGWRGPHLDPLLQVGPKTMLVVDESSAISNHESLQSRAMMAIREKCDRVIELNGTPYGENPEDLYGQAKLLDWRILGFSHISQFRNRYAVMGGHHIEMVKFGRKIKVPVEVLGWRHKPRLSSATEEACCEIPPFVKSPIHEAPYIEEVREQLAPYILRRSRKDWFDYPEKLEPVALTATLSAETWKHYKAMRDDTVSWLSSNVNASALQAGVVVMRLAQITSGFLGGLRDMEAVCPICQGSGLPPAGMTALMFNAILKKHSVPVLPEAARTLFDQAPGQPAAAGDALGVNLDGPCPACWGEGTLPLPVPPREIGREKLDLFLAWVKQRLEADRNMRMIYWCRFRPELHRMVDEVTEKFPRVTVRAIHGGQKREERQEGLRLMHPDVTYEGPALLGATQGTGSQGLPMAGAHEEVFGSSDYSLMKRQQSEDRPLGPGQTQSVSIHDIHAVGPNGQKTIDHIIAKELRTKRDMAEWTTSRWAEMLTKEDL